jgi:hypothetical protein
VVVLGCRLDGLCWDGKESREAAKKKIGHGFDGLSRIRINNRDRRREEGTRH